MEASDEDERLESSREGKNILTETKATRNARPLLLASCRGLPG